MLKIVSGGQTGVDRAAWDVAIRLGLAYGGWVPKGALDETGRIPERYRGYVEAMTPEPALRTHLNVGSADATLIIRAEAASPGTEATIASARELARPFLVIERPGDEALRRVCHWLDEVEPIVLNVAGPRASEAPHLYAHALALLEPALRAFVTGR